jgi:hypothetical protein
MISAWGGFVEMLQLLIHRNCLLNKVSITEKYKREEREGEEGRTRRNREKGERKEGEGLNRGGAEKIKSVGRGHIIF